VVFEWSKVPDAAGYAIEIDYYDGHWSSETGRTTFITRVKDPAFTFNFYGDQPGSWRVWALGMKQRKGQVSRWSVFVFGPGNQPIPTPPPDTAPRAKTPQLPPNSTPRGNVPDPPVFDPDTGEACAWPLGTPQGVTMPKAVYTPEPDLPVAASRARVGGDVTLAVDLGEDGLVKRVCILTASRNDLAQEALKKVRTWRFEPARKDGAPISYSTTVEVSFRLGR
jgi:TonB family protein